MPPRCLRLGQGSAKEVQFAFLHCATVGGLLLFPTDTVYGLGVRADDEQAVQRLYEVKGRPADLALPILVGTREQVCRVAAAWPPAAQALAEVFWPGPLTIVVPRAQGLSSLVTGGAETVGVRLPAYAPLQDWLSACDFPVAVTSANLSGEPPALQVSDLSAPLREAVDLVLDGGPCAGTIPSTVVDVACSPPRVLRVGPVSEQDIRRVVAKVQGVCLAQSAPSLSEQP